MRHTATLLLLLTLLAPSRMTAQDSLRIARYYVASHQVGLLQWNALPGATDYSLYRQMPGQQGYSLRAVVTDTQYYDTLHRVVCGDTVGYYVVCDSLVSDTVGIFYQDNLPTSPCTLHLATVDDALQRINLSWNPSPDTDVMGYYICMGNPCRDFDTVWGRMNTTYLCDNSVDCHTEHSFRILAFDSCFQASPLTPYYHNPVISLTAAPCSRTLHVAWNRYINMPDSVGRYIVWYRMHGDSTLYHKGFPAATGTFAYDLTVSNLDVKWVEACVTPVNSNDSLGASSAWERLVFDVGDTAAYARIATAVYDETLPSVELTFDVDSAFHGTEYRLMRASAADTAFELLTTLHSTAPYSDLDINRTALRYIYRLEVPDLCRQRVVTSDTLGVDLPPVGDITAFFPNMIRPEDPENSRFCPLYFSPLAAGYSLDIYNRWGLHLWHTERLEDCWDGTHDGTPVPQGTYVFRAHVRHADGSDKTYFGNITVIR